ncbi:MAG: PIN domain-containing protein [Patescibacteria group bacterium]
MKMKNEDLILDSNVLIAFVNTSDNLHVKSVSVMKETSFRKKIISDLIFAEIGTVLLMKTKQTRLVSGSLRDILFGKVENIQVSTLTKHLLAQTLEIFSQQKHSRLSFEDCSVIALARSLRIRKIVTFDKALRMAFAKEFEFLPKNI